jgi:HAD superfamily hydrolase (TIGR01549 family)
VNPVRAVFFDVGWTLSYPERSLWDCFAEVIREEGIETTSGEVEQTAHSMIASRREVAIREFLDGAEYPDSDEAFEAIFLVMGHVMFKKVGVEGDRDALTRDVLERFWLLENWAIYPDVINAIERLRAQQIRIGILSNATSALVGFLEEIGLLQYFDFAVISAIEGTKKPDRRIFERALEQAGVEVADAAHVGDMYLEDILGARNVGVRPFLIDRGRDSLFPSFPEAAEHSPEEVEIVRGLDPMLEALGVE